MAMDFGSGARRVDGFIRVVWGHRRNTASGPKNKRDEEINFSEALTRPPPEGKRPVHHFNGSSVSDFI